MFNAQFSLHLINTIFTLRDLQIFKLTHVQFDRNRKPSQTLSWC